MIDASRPAPPLRTLSPRAEEVVAVALRVLEAEGADALTMRRLGDELSVKAPSLYKHVEGKAEIELALIDGALLDLGVALRAAVDGLDPTDAVVALLDGYRRVGLDHPNLYRLATQGPLRRDGLTPGLEDWSGEPFLLVMGDPFLAQAVWSCAHGMVILELDGRYPPDSDLDRTWAEAAAAFVAALRARVPG